MAITALRKANADEAKIEALNIRLDKKKEDIASLRTDYEVNKLELEKIAKHKPTLEKIQKVFMFWSWKKNWLKISGVIFVVLAVFVAMLIGVVYYMHKRGWVTYEIPQKTGMQQIEADIKTGNVSPITRTIHYNKLSDAQNDSIHTRNQEQIKRMIKPVNGMGK
jgi:negative regulator of sigma E activity